MSDDEEIVNDAVKFITDEHGYGINTSHHLHWVSINRPKSQTREVFTTNSSNEIPTAE